MFSLSGLQLRQNRIIEGNAEHMLLSMSYSRTDRCFPNLQIMSSIYLVKIHLYYQISVYVRLKRKCICTLSYLLFSYYPTEKQTGYQK